MKKRVFYTEISYIAGLLFLAVGASMMVKGDLGVSMVVAPAYILHLKISEFLPFFSFGMAEYTFQALLLIITVIVLRKFRLSYLFSFVTAVIYAFLLDGAGLLMDLLPALPIGIRVIFFCIGAILSAIGVAFMFHTYLSAEVYELFVKEVSARFNIPISRFKTFYDCGSCLLAIILSFAFFGMWHFEGVKIGTIIVAFTNGALIGAVGKFLEAKFEFADRFPNIAKKYRD